MPLHRVVKDSPTPADDLIRVVRRLERNGHRVLQVTEQPAEWLILTDSKPARWFTRDFSVPERTS